MPTMLDEVTLSKTTAVSTFFEVATTYDNALYFYEALIMGGGPMLTGDDTIEKFLKVTKWGQRIQPLHLIEGLTIFEIQSRVSDLHIRMDTIAQQSQLEGYKTGYRAGYGSGFEDGLEDGLDNN